jgi:hypothetical protein
MQSREATAPSASGTLSATVPPASGTPEATRPSSSVTPELRWARVARQQALEGSRMTGVAAGVEGYVAVGYTADDPSVGIAWRSAEGRAWQRSALLDGRPGGIVRDEIGYLAWGRADSGAAVWVSSDGASWRSSGELPMAGSTDIDGIARLGSQVIAVGSEGIDSPDSHPRRLRMWASTDGLVWIQLAPVLPDVQIAWVGGVAAVNGTLVVTVIPSSDAADSPVAMASQDGGTWVAGEIPDVHAWVLDLVAGRDSLVAVGHLPGVENEAPAPPPPSAAWRSSDGVTWSASDFLPERPMGHLGQVTWDGGRFVALGRSEIESTCWLSADGASWADAGSAPDTAIDGEEAGCTGGPCPRTEVHDLVFGAAGFVAVGDTTLDGGARAAVWLAPPGAD